MSMHDMVRLAGLDIDIPVKDEEQDTEQGIDQSIELTNEPEVENTGCCSDIKYAIIEVIEYYNDESRRTNLPNVRSVYSDIINKLDDILGLILDHREDEVRVHLCDLDDSIQAILLKHSESFSKYLGTCDEVTESLVLEVDKVIDIEDSLEDNEPMPEIDDETVKIPAGVISDLRSKIREFEDEKFSQHLPGHEVRNQKYKYVRKSLENILDYLINPSERSIQMATVYITSLDSATKYYIPDSVWRFLPSIRNFETSSIKSILQRRGTK